MCDWPFEYKGAARPPATALEWSMREIWRHRGMRLIFTANLISMIGSGMNSAAVTWYILQATHSEVWLGVMIALMTLPSLVLLPLTGVIIDRNDRRHLMMGLDAARGAVIFTIAILALTHRVHLWHLYAMTMVVSMGFWMFWPTLNALVQELAPEDKFLDSNSLMLAAVQGGWMLAGAVVGFMYNHIGLGGVLLIDTTSYLASIACVFHVRKGRVIVTHPESEQAAADHPTKAAARYLHELREGFNYVANHRRALLLGLAWALFIAAMMTSGVLTAPLSDRILHAGAVGYGWQNAGWAVGAFVSVIYASRVIRRYGANRSVTVTMSVIACSLLPVAQHPLARPGGAGVFHHGLRPRCGRDCDLHRDDGDGAQIFHGPGAEHVLLSGQRAADRNVAAGRRSGASRRSALRVLADGLNVSWGCDRCGVAGARE